MLASLALLSMLSQDVAAAPALRPEPLEDEAYAETFTAVASLKDGSYVLMQLLFTNAGMGDGKAACRALWVPPGGEGMNASVNLSGGQWSYDSAREALVVGPCRLGATSTGLQFRADLPDLSMDLRIESSPRTIEPPGHRIQVNGTFYESDLVVPRAAARVTVSGSGQTLDQSGYVHLDHSRSNALLPKVAGCWMRFRGFEGSQPLLAQVRTPPSGARADGWVWSLSKGAPSPVGSDGVGVGHTGAKLPTLTLRGPDGTVAVQASKTIYRYRPTEAYGAMGRIAAPWIGDPTTTTYSATATTASGSKTQGILEVSEINPGSCKTQ